MKILTFVALAIWAVMSTSVPATESEPRVLQFRDVFGSNSGKPSRQGANRSGKAVQIVGFLAPPPTNDSPFVVMVGAPTSFCPYCTAVDEQDHLPYILVYPDAPMDLSSITTRTRVRVEGIISVSHDHEDRYGLHNDVRILKATITRDQRAINPVQALLRQKRAADHTRPARPAAPIAIDE
ncbi:MAG: hypothetical protein AAFP68_17545 [Pseudomonadota bacterium]